MIKRVMGKASFGKIADRTGQIQLYLQQEALGAAYEDFKGWDIGDLVGASGVLFRTKKGELSVRVEALRLLVSRCGRCRTSGTGSPTPRRATAALRRPDRERGEPQRIPHPHPHCALPARLSRCARFSRGRDADDAADPGRRQRAPFRTHHNALNLDMYLRVAPELYLKRLIVGGLERVYEINRNFRNEGLSTQHNPEFTMLELYLAYADFRDLMDWIEKATADWPRRCTARSRSPTRGAPTISVRPSSA